MTEYNETIKQIPMPARIAKLPVSKRGYPVPWFVPWNPETGEPVTQAADPVKVARAKRHKLCWVCGEPLGVYKTFVIGPMCAVNRVSSEPPSHLECAEYAVRACPFLINPRMKRNPVDDPRKQDPAGFMIERNPGVSLVWVTRSYMTVRAFNGELFSIGDPVQVLWYREGRTATRAEILEALESGLPLLFEAAGSDAEALHQINKSYHKALAMVPA